MNNRSKPVDDRHKRSTSPTLRTNLVQGARLLDGDLSAAAAEGTNRAAAEARDRQWIERNCAAMASYDAFVEREGLFLNDLRTF